MPGTHHDLVDPIEDLGGEQAHILLERLQAVARLIGPVAVAEHLADRRVLVGQLQNAIIVGIQPQAQRTEHQDLPLLHAGPAGVGAGLAIRPLGEHFGEDGEDLLAQFRHGVDVLQPTQNARYVISRLGIELDGRDVLLAELQLWIDDLTHGVSNDEVY